MADPGRNRVGFSTDRLSLFFEFDDAPATKDGESQSGYPLNE